MLVFRRLKPYYWPYRYTLLAAMSSMALLTAVGLVRPVVTAAVVDDVVLAGRYRLLPWLVAAVLAVALVRGVFNYGRQYLGEQFGQQVVYDVRNALYRKLQALPFSYHDRAQTGNLMSRLTGDVEALRMFLAFGLVFLADFLFMVGFSLAVMLSIHVPLTLVTMALMPLLAVSAWSFERRVRPAFSDVREAMARLTTVVQESITGVRTVKSFARERHEIDKFSDKNVGYLSSNLAAARLWSTYFPFMEFVGNSTTVLLIWYGGRLVVAGELSLGSLVAFFSLIWYLIWPVRELGFLVNLATQAVAAGDRLLEILDAPETVGDRPRAIELHRCRGHVRFENAGLRYPESGGSPAIEGIDVDARPGSVIALIGATGSGKSSVVSLIPRFYDVTAGRVTVDGIDVRDIRLKSLRRHVAVVLQETFLFSASIRENIGYGNREASMDEIVAAAKAARAHEFIMATPQGYDTVVGERGLGLSGGQKQRVAIARALLTDPAILILDDATSSVDMETEHEIQRALLELMRGRTTFVIAHRLSSLKHADEILVMDRGRIIQRGTHSELLRRDGPYREIYAVQFAERDPDRVATAAGEV